MKFWFRLPLYTKIFVMIALGAIVGYFMGSNVKLIQPLGDAFIRLLKMLIVPLVFFTLVSGVTKLGSPKELKRIGGFIVLYYILTSALAAFMGTMFGLALRPGLGAQGLLGDVSSMSVAKYNVVETLLNWIPTNPVQAMAEASMLQIIVFSLFVGVALLVLGDKAKAFTEFMNQGADTTIKITELVMEVAPYGIFALVANMVGTLGSKMLAAAAKFIMTDYIALLAVLLIVYPVLMLLIGKGKLPVFKFFQRIFPAMVVAASTTSSATTLPVEMKIAEQRLGVPNKIFGFSLPLGNTANMDGFAAAVGVISVFALDIFNIPFTLGTIVQIVFLGLILSIGAAGVKGAGIVMSAVLFETLGLPLTLLPTLAAVWPIIDIMHTTTNVTGDMVGTTLCAVHYDELDWKVFNSEVEPVKK